MLSKETIDLINVKCHDLKYQIRQIAEAKQINPDTIERLSDVISIYDSTMKTGNATLDVILSQKSLFCSQNGIKFACIADGGQLNFLSEEDTYSLFGNIIDNAIEAVKNLEKEKRIITLRVIRKGNMISVNERNPFEGTIHYESGWPTTSKSDSRYHGFGIKSIRMVCEKHHASLSLSSESNTFNISILFIKPSETEEPPLKSS
jgi:sensor histidine kinase regulating citrate/malate metabolism